MKRIVAMSDFHCGHVVGLTPPGWQKTPLSAKTIKFQSEVWDFFSSTLEKLKPIDILLFVGDAVEGKNERSGGTELITADRIEQAEMAATCLLEAKAKKIYMVYGTPYHTGVEEDWERLVAEKAGAEISGHEFVDVEGKIFDIKHFIGSSNIPHGRYTAIARDMLWNIIWAQDDCQPDSDVVIRAHVHYFAHVHDGKKLGIILPGLQGYGSKFGIRRCSGRVDIGFIHFEIDEGNIRWHGDLFQSDILKVEPKRP